MTASETYQERSVQRDCDRAEPARSPIPPTMPDCHSWRDADRRCPPSCGPAFTVLIHSDAVFGRPLGALRRHAREETEDTHELHWPVPWQHAERSHAASGATVLINSDAISGRRPGSIRAGKSKDAERTGMRSEVQSACSSNQRSASIAAEHPMPAAVIAWR